MTYLRSITCPGTLMRPRSAPMLPLRCNGRTQRAWSPVWRRRHWARRASQPVCRLQPSWCDLLKISQNNLYTMKMASELHLKPFLLCLGSPSLRFRPFYYSFDNKRNIFCIGYHHKVSILYCTERKLPNPGFYPYSNFDFRWCNRRNNRQDTFQFQGRLVL